jgi:hypothetical protein
MRKDGTAASVTEAVGPTSDATKCMSPGTHNSGTFVGDDTIYISDKGGTYTPSGAQASIIIPPSDGYSGSLIVYAKAPGETPTINMKWTDNGDDWTSIGSGKYTKTYSGGDTGFYGVVVWEDGVALDIASSAANVGTNGDWFYGSGLMTYKPSSGTPADHVLTAVWQEGQFGSNFAVDLKDRSFVEVSGLTIDYGCIRVGQATGSTTTVLDGIKVHDCTFNYSPWAISGQVWLNNCVFQNAEFYNNTINYSNCGISVWTNSDETVHTQKTYKVKIYDNTINHHYSIDSAHDWNYASSYNVDHEGISLQDMVNCEVTGNAITMDVIPVTAGQGVRAIYLYPNLNGDSSDGNIVVRNKISGAFDYPIRFQGSGSTGGNTIACNTINYTGTASTLGGPVGIICNPASNSSTEITYICNNTINIPNRTTASGVLVTGGGKFTIKNNIINAKQYYLSLYYTNAGDMVVDNNNYYGAASSLAFTANDIAKNFTDWKLLGFDTTYSVNAVNPMIRAYDLATQTISPTAVKIGGLDTIIATLKTLLSQDPLLGIDGVAYNVTTPAMGAFGGTVPPGGGGLDFGLGLKGNFNPTLIRKKR